MHQDFVAGEGSDVSLITGKVRTLGTEDKEESNSDNALMAQETAVGLLHQNGGGEFLSQRGWQGLEQKLGETPVVKARKGRPGIAWGYEGEGK